MSINIAQIGIGYWGPNLLRNLVSNKECKVTAVVDIAQERQNYVKRLYPGIYTTDSFREILQDPTINAVIIAKTGHSPNFDLHNVHMANTLEIEKKSVNNRNGNSEIGKNSFHKSSHPLIIRE